MKKEGIKEYLRKSLFTIRKRRETQEDEKNGGHKVGYNGAGKNLISAVQKMKSKKKAHGPTKVKHKTRDIFA